MKDKKIVNIALSTFIGSIIESVLLYAFLKEANVVDVLTKTMVLFPIFIVINLIIINLYNLLDKKMK